MITAIAISMFCAAMISALAGLSCARSTFRWRLALLTTILAISSAGWFAYAGSWLLNRQ
jgi:hypothetical protein